MKLTWGGRPFKKQKENNLASGTIVAFERKYNPERKSPEPSLTSQQTVFQGQEQTSPTYAAQTNSFMNAFRNIQTPDSVVKQFINDVLLPGLNSSNSLEFQSDTESSPDNLVYMEKSLVFPAEADMPMNFAMDHITGFETIPDLFIHLPDLLLQNPLYKEHYHAYIEVHSKMLCPAPPRMYTDNPFTCLLPRMSLTSSSDGLLSMLIAFSISRSSAFKSEPYPREAASLLLNKALEDLYRRLTNPREANTDYTLALVLLLACFEIFCDADSGWRAHHHGARQILFSRGLLRATTSMMNRRKRRVAFKQGAEDDIHFFFNRWFAYLDVIGSLSSSSSIYNSSRMSDIEWECPKPTRQERERLMDIDPFSGFDIRLLEYFSMVVNLVEKRQAAGCVSSGTLPLSLIREALDVKQYILDYLKETDLERREIKKEILSDPLNVLNDQLADYELLRATNIVFGLSGVLQIYRRVLMMPRDTAAVQDLVEQVTTVIRDQIPKYQPAAHCTLFSLFSCGSEALKDEDKEFYKHRMTVLAENGLATARKALEVMEEGWKTGKHWADIMAEHRLDMIFV